MRYETHTLKQLTQKLKIICRGVLHSYRILPCSDLGWRLSLMGVAGFLKSKYSGVEQKRSARQAHNLKVAGSNPAPAIYGLDKPCGV